MIVINLGHRLTPEQQSEIEYQTSEKIEEIIEIAVRYDIDANFADQTIAYLDMIGLPVADWHSRSIVFILPGLGTAAACLVADIHRRVGRFPKIVRTKQSLNSNSRLAHLVSEIIDLQVLSEHGGQHE